MLNFGMSAYLKLLALNPRPRETEIRKRLVPKKNGYDYYRAMRRIAPPYAAGVATWDETQSALNKIVKLGERVDATNASTSLARWAAGRPIRLNPKWERSANSPSNIFSVKFQSDLEIDIDGTPTNIHIWNTQKPPLKLREAVGAVGLFYRSDDAPQCGILSLRTEELFIIRRVESAQELALLLARDIETRIQRIQEELSERRIGDRPDDSAIA